MALNAVQKTVAIVALTFVGTGIGAAAEAANYGPVAIRDGGREVGRGSGDHIGITNTHAGGHHRRFDSRAGGSGIYSEVWVQWYGQYCTSDGTNHTTCWSKGSTKESKRNFARTWKDWPYYSTLNTNAEKIRETAWAAMDKARMPDPTSTKAIFTWSY